MKIGARNFLKWLVPTLVLSLVALFVWQIYPSNVRLAKLPVIFTDAGVPVVEVKIAKKTFPVIVDLGSKLELSLAQEVLKGIPHKLHATENISNFRGTQFKRTTYKIPSINLGSMPFNNPIVVGRPAKDEQEYVIWQSSQAESERVPCGALGRGLLKETNLLIDMKHSQLIVTSRKELLKAEGYELESFTKVPFTLDAKGLIIDLDTDFGKKRFLVDTGFTLTMMHKYLFPKGSSQAKKKYNLPVISSEHFSIGGKEYGSKEIYFLEMAKDLQVFDGVLGMDFISKHVMYIDFSELQIYIGDFE